MAVRVTNVSDSSLFEFTCAQWALMSDASKADWTVTENTCGIQTGYGNPYAATDLIFTLNGVLGAQAPITLTLIDGVYTVGISPASADGPGSMSVDDWLKAQAYLEPVSLNTISSAIPAGAVTSISVATALLANEYVAGDVFSVVNNDNGERVKLTVTASTTAGATTIAVSGTAADTIPIGGILVPIFSVRQILTAGSGITITSGAIINTAPDQVVTLTNGASISVTGTYPNFTIANTAPDQVVSLTAGSNITITGTYPNFTIAATGGSGTVTSVGLSLPSIFSVSGSPVTTSGTLTGTLANQNANLVFAGPNTGAAAVPTFRALVTADLANDLVTYAKIQNVSATSRILGRITAGAGDIEELTAANMQTILGYVDGTGVANQIMYWSDANTAAGDAAFTVDAVNNRMTITGTIAGIGANSGFLNLNSGAITGATEFLRQSGNINGNMIMNLLNANNASTGSNSIFQISVGGASAGDPVIQFTVSGAVSHAIGTDNGDNDKFKITPNSATPGGNANASFVATNAASPQYGFNRDAPGKTVDVDGTIRGKAFEGFNGTVTQVYGTGAGTGPTTQSLVGSSTVVEWFWTSGTTPTAGAVITTITLPWSVVGMSPQLQSWDADAAAAIGAGQLYIDSVTGNTIVIRNGNGALPASTSFRFKINILGTSE